ncbi:hypothetical protein CL629_01340 [bacterium]|nr:hypothetical protein [bacterium]|tara:strand:+ start:2386 stop:2916 length:531 start_codon:yes stop_codon:yes gene_type:complete
MDLSLFEFFYSFAHRSPFWDGFIVFFASYVPYLLGIGILFFVYRISSSWKNGLYLISVFALTAILSRGILAELIGFFSQKPRPSVFLDIAPLFLKEGFSFPSGHAAFFFALSFFAFIVYRKWGIVFLGISILIGIARIIAGVHFPVDILGGIVVGFISFVLVYSFLPPRLIGFRSS